MFFPHCISEVFPLKDPRSFKVICKAILQLQECHSHSATKLKIDGVYFRITCIFERLMPLNVYLYKLHTSHLVKQ